MKKFAKILLATICVAGSHQARGDDSPLTGRYWFDHSTETTLFTPGQLEISTDRLQYGLHSLNAYVESNGMQSSVVSSWFIKTMSLKAGDTYTTVTFLDGIPFKVQQVQAIGDGVLSLQLDMDALPLGLHSLMVQVVSPTGDATDVKETMFMRVPTTKQLSEMRGYYVIDNSRRGEIEASLIGNTFHLDLDVSALTAGLHSVSVYLSGPSGLTSSVETGWFIKLPKGGEGVKTYEYWLNDNYSNVKSVTLEKVSNPFSLISLIDVDEEPLRTTDYTFAIEDGVPAIYAHNNFQIRFFDPEGRITIDSKSFTDTRVKQLVTDVAKIEGQSTVTIPSIEDNEIKWFSFEAEAGDTLSLRLDRSAMYELFAPDAGKVMAKAGNDAMTTGGLSLNQTGRYYLAVHDISGYSKTNTNVYFEHIPRFALLSSTPEKAGAKGLLSIDIHGNGFDKLKGLVLSNGVNTVALDELVKVDSRYNMSVMFNINNMKLTEGRYDLVATFDDDGKDVAVTKSGAIELVAPSKADVTVEVVTPRIARTPYEIYIDVTNHSEQSCWGVPVNIAVANTEQGIGIECLNFITLDDADDIIPTEMPEYFLTDNLLGNEKEGLMVPLFLPYLGPRETVRLSLGLYSSAHDLVPVYAWCGQPWSDEFEELMAEDFDVEQLRDYVETNILTARELCYLELFGDEAENDMDGDKLQSIKPRQVTTGNGVSNVYYKAVDEAQRQYNLMLSHQQHSPNSFFKTYADHITKEYFNIDRIFDAYPTVTRVRIKVIRKGNGSSSSGGNKPSIPSPAPPCHLVDCLQSGDPNDISGYLSPSGDRYIGLGVKTINYTIEFENDPEIATASASVIKVENEIVGGKLDLATFKPLTLKIGDKETDLPAGHHIVKTLDMRPSINAVAELTFDFDEATGKATWNLRSLDPMTMEPSKYMDDGILPVNDDTKRGVGYLTYSIDLLPTVADGDEIANSATIIFDDNEPINTPVWVNTTDYTLPEAKIVDQSTDDGFIYTFTVEGSDTGSGIWIYDLYARKAGTGEWRLLKGNIEDDTFTFTADVSMADYQFTVIATDRAGNRQSEVSLNIVPGDADGNGEVNAADVVLTRNYYTGTATSINFNGADVTMDGNINAQDALAIRNLYLDTRAKIQTKRLTRRKQ